MGNFIGRRVAVGLSQETVRGTTVAPAFWFRHLSLDFARKTKTIQNNSAMNRMEAVNDSALVQQWGEGKLEGKVGDTGIGYLLANIFGALPTSAVHAAETTVFDHTFAIGQTNTPPTMTITRVDPNSDRRHAYGTLKSLEIDAQAGDWVKASGDLIADKGTDATDTVAFVSENEFTSKHITVKLAANLAGLGAAVAIKASSLKIKIDRKAEPYFGFNATDPANFFVGSYEVTGELVLTYDDTTFETLHYGNTIQYLQAVIKNTDVNIGVVPSNPSLTFNAPKARIEDWSMSNDLDKVIEQTLAFYMEFDVSSAMALQAILTNTKTNYTT